MRSGIPIEAEAATNEVDLSRVGRVLLKKRWWVLGPTLLAFVGALVFVNAVKPRYTSDARLLLENQDNFFTRVDKGERTDANGPDAESVQSQIQLLTSRDLARRVIKQLDLQGNPEFDPVSGGLGALTRVLVLLGIARDPTNMSPEDRMLEKFSEKLSVLSPTKTRVLSVEFTSRNPDLAARAANAIAETYIEMQQEAKRDLAHSAAQSLSSLVADLRTRVGEAEDKVEAYRSQTGLLIGANNATIPTQQLGELNNQLSTARAVQAESQAKANLLRDMLRQHRVGEIPDVANNEVMRRIFEQRVALRAQLALESRTLLPMHPRIKELEAQLTDLDQQWRAAAERTARTLENEAKIASARVENLTKALEDQKRVAGTAGAEEVKLRELERSARLLKEQLENVTAKYQEAVARERAKATPADARIIQRALAPQIPSFPKKVPIVAFATVAALILSIGGIISVEMLGGGVRFVGPTPGLDAPRLGETDAEIDDAPVVRPASRAAVSDIDDARADPPARRAAVVAETPDEADAFEPDPDQRDARPAAVAVAEHEIDAYPDDARIAAILAEAEEETPARGGKTQDAVEIDDVIDVDDVPAVERIDSARMVQSCVKVLVTPCERDGNPADTVIALARNLARRGRTMLVVADRGAKPFDAIIDASDETPLGLSDLLAGEAEFGDAIHRDAQSRLHVMPGGASKSAEQHDLAIVATALAHAYDFVVFAASARKAMRVALHVDLAFVIGGDEGAEALRQELEEAGADARLLENGKGLDDLVAA